MSTLLEEQVEGTLTPVEVRADARLAGGVGAVAAVVALAYLTRALGGGGWLDWALALVVGGIAVAHLQSLLDARLPLLVVDEHGVRLRRGKAWEGLPWSDIEHVEHEPRRGLFRDGSVVLVPRDEAAPTRAVALTLSTRVVGDEGDLTAALERLAADPDQVVEVVEVVELVPEDLEEWDEAIEEDRDDAPVDELEVGLLDEELLDDEPVADESHHATLHDPRPTIARGIGFLADRLALRRSAAPQPQDQPHDELHDELHDEPQDEDELQPVLEDERAPEPTVPIVVASATPLPLRDAVTGVRSEVRFEGAAALRLDRTADETQQTTALPEADELRRTSGDLEDTVMWSDAVAEPVVIDDLAPAPAADPVIGPELAAARVRLALSVDQLAERTRIRPHVIESIEVDDFAPCGGDFYARGHLRTLARVLGVDAAPLLSAYDERYSDAPIDARRVFEAELATSEGGPIRGTRGGPNWSVLIAAVMAVVLAWSIARLVMDSPIELDPKPVLNGSPSSPAKLGPPVPVEVVAATGGAHVVVRDGAGKTVYNGDLAFGDSQTIKAVPPVVIQSSDGGLKVTVDGQDHGALGAEGQMASNTFAAAE